MAKKFTAPKCVKKFTNSIKRFVFHKVKGTFDHRKSNKSSIDIEERQKSRNQNVYNNF